MLCWLPCVRDVGRPARRVTSATSESLNRIAKLEARMAYGFRNPENQCRRVRIACTRGTRRLSPNAANDRKQPVISRKQVPG